ncbi:hypothetical protein NL676_008388 [Syzygium grande]|nr:hypothetical protein NL676_008388 [Syzygium grande]
MYVHISNPKHTCLSASPKRKQINNPTRATVTLVSSPQWPPVKNANNRLPPRTPKNAKVAKTDREEGDWIGLILRSEKNPNLYLLMKATPFCEYPLKLATD